MQSVKVAMAFVFLPALLAQEKPAGKPTRSLAAGLVRQQAEVEKLALPVAKAGLEVGSGKGGLVLLVRRADGSLHTHELQRGEGDHGPAAKPSPTPAEIPEDGPEPPQPARVELRRDGERITLGLPGKPPAVTGKELDRDGCRRFFATLREGRNGRQAGAVVFDAAPDVTMQQWLTAWEVARDAGWTSIAFDGGGKAKVALDEAQRTVIRELPAKHEWPVRMLAPQQPLCSGELLVMLEADVAWGEVRPLVFAFAEAGIWEFGFVCKQDDKTWVKLPTHLPVDGG